ncbi:MULTISPECIES: acyl-CoA dehydrogenase [Gordonia]|uniref:Acyl-CoA dehydrogenase n=1 Tax=Gordonia hongkongensis TaxID=1701090 RepID=A0ABT6BWF0_9ACTN|nr:MULTISPECIES: acyl-CoA dehydrogenase [Gordonia]MCT1351959.1 acyl-CoA dehydrogenase [Gordonia sp. p3-SID1431]MDF6102391.1 acyl-CoA dehydrogenase [Gordonia hongkongensis]UPG67788.1 acyl-CoA dehydrogenase [Gordonia hongkongensis]WGJ87958.1 acyl-CoA dehydrogenase [Gordonia sp. SMJS1]
MALAISSEHIDLADAAVGHLARHGVRAAARASLDGAVELETFWSSTADLGWLGLHLPEEYGGSGYGIAELAVVLEAMGHELAPGPFLSTVVASAVIAHAGDEDLRAELLPGLADGSTTGAVGLANGLSRDADGLISGQVRAVLSAPEADLLVLSLGDDLVVLDKATAGVEVAAAEALDTTRGIGTVSLTAVAVPTNRVLRSASRAGRSVLRVLAAAEAIGGALACLEMATDYAKVREQFGRSIGSFQAVKHHCANMLIATEASIAATWDAARASDIDGIWFASAVAAAYAGPAQLGNARMNIQLHGGIGFTWEHDAHLYLRRATTVAAILTDGVDPLADIVDAYRAGQAQGASFDLPPEAEEFRAAARAEAQAVRSLPEGQRRDHLVDSGYLVPHWRRPWGREAGAIEQLVIEEEFEGIDLPDLGITGWVNLTIAQVGSDDQRERWIEPVLRGRDQWCQLFSEPGAGSDAAAVRTVGKKVDGGWRVTGQKVWTSVALECQWGLATVRTDPDASKHAGVSMMAIDLSSEGVQIRPLREITGEALFNEVFFDDVFVPDSDVVGEVGEGWKVARATLGNERVSIGGGSGSIDFGVAELVKLLDGTGARDAEHRVGEMIAEAHTLRLLNLRQAARAVIGAGPGPEANVTKLIKAEHSQRITELGIDLAGTAAVTGNTPGLTYAYLFARCLTIAGGTSEIMRNTIAERLLGLPREPSVR